MRKIVNVILIIGSIISFILALKFSSLPVITFLPDAFTDFWITPEKIQQQFVLVYDVAVGFILSALFYFVVDEIPEQVKIAKAKKILSGKVNLLHQHMNVIINLIIFNYGISKDLYSLTKKDFLILDGNASETSKEISYHIEVFRGKERKTGFHNYGTLDDIIKNKISEILKDIDYIKNYEYLYATCTEFMEEIRNIEGCSMIKCYRKDTKSPNKCFIYDDTSRMLSEFVASFLRLDRLRFHTEYSIVTLESKAETQKYHDDRKSGRLINQVVRGWQEEHDNAVKNRIIVACNNDYYSRIILNKFKRSLEAEYVEIDALTSDMIKEHKWLISIIDKNSFERVDNIFQTLNTQINVIMLIEKNILRKSYWKRLNNSKANVKGKFFYKVTRRIWRTHLYVNRGEPSEGTIDAHIKEIKSIILGTNKE